jgi:hypothetical protein
LLPDDNGQARNLITATSSIPTSVEDDRSRNIANYDIVSQHIEFFTRIDATVSTLIITNDLLPMIGFYRVVAESL